MTPHSVTHPWLLRRLLLLLPLGVGEEVVSGQSEELLQLAVLVHPPLVEGRRVEVHRVQQGEVVQHPLLLLVRDVNRQLMIPYHEIETPYSMMISIVNVLLTCCSS